MTGGGKGVVTSLTSVPMKTKTFTSRYDFSSKSPVSQAECTVKAGMCNISKSALLTQAK